MNKRKIIILLTTIIIISMLLTGYYIYLVDKEINDICSDGPIPINIDEIIEYELNLQNSFSINDLEYLNRLFQTYWDDYEDNEILNIYGNINEKPSNSNLFSFILKYDLDTYVDIIELNNTDVGLKFVKDTIYTENYRNGGIKHYYVEYGICYIYDEYMNNLPDNSEKLLCHFDNLYGNLYGYVLKVYI